MAIKETIKEFIKRKQERFEKEKERTVAMKDIGRDGRIHFIKEAWTFLPASNLKKHKVFVLERLRKVKFEGTLAYKKSWKTGEVEYRIGYFIVGRIGRAKGRWVWGQFCPIIPAKDLKHLISKAEKEGVLL
ncbi:hypothetical protein HYT45_02695 [Candidatus Uhrbacteria bacterium]|nr:hypothetical protein [Candidatus Uhrbacteria bacterium]